MLPDLLAPLVRNPNPSIEGLPASVSSLTNTGAEFDTGYINPTGLTGTINDWAPTGFASAQYIYATSANTGATSFTGIAGGTDGRMITIIADPANTSGNGLTLNNESASSIAANRMTFIGANAIVLGAASLSSVTLRYNGTAQRWQEISRSSTQWNMNVAFIGQFTLQNAAILSTSVQSPAALASGTTNDYSPTAGFRYRLTPASGGSTISSLAQGVASGTGRIAIFQNISTTDTITLLHDDGASGTAANRFLFSNGANRVLPPGGAIAIMYDGTSARWRPIGNGGEPAQVIFPGSQSSTVTGTQDDFALSANATRLVWTGASQVTFDGFAGGVDGRILIVENASAGPSTLTIASEAAGSTAVNRATGTANANIVVTGAGSQAILLYEGSTSRWRLIGLSSTTLSQGITLGSPVTMSGTISPTALSGSTNDYAPTSGTTTFAIRQDISSAATITGLSLAQANGRIILLHNIATTAGDTLTITNEDGLSTAANRFTLPQGQPYIIQPGGSVLLRYDGTSSRWRVDEPIGSQLSTQADTSTGTVNDFALTSGVSVLRLTPASTVTITGIAGGLDGRLLYIENAGGAGSVILSNESAGSSAANRLYNTAAAATINLSPPGATGTNGALFIYDGTSSRWRMVLYCSGQINVATSFTANLTIGSAAHLKTSGTTPTITSGAGASPTITGSDVAFTLTPGAGATNALITFAATYTTVPTVVVSASTGVAVPYTKTATTLTLTGVVAGTDYDVMVIGH